MPTTGVVTRIDAEGVGAGDREVLAHSVASDYFSTLKMPLVRGRGWSAADDAREEPEWMPPPDITPVDCM